jgi:aminoglycoside phosphotransferase (APT) family kinase protein
VDAALRHWLESALGGSVTTVRRAFGGGSRETWFVEMVGPDGPRRVVVRHQGPAGAFVGSPFSLAREAVVYRALQGTGVPVAALLAVSPEQDTLVLSHLPGTARTVTADWPEASDTVMQSFFEALGRLHRLDPEPLSLPGFSPPADPPGHALDDLARWRDLAARHGLTTDPMIAFALAWLQANPPGSVARTVLVQGDTGPGNFLHDRGEVTGLVDWEFAHLGDPMDDIAWIDMRSGSHGAFGDAARRDRLYRQAAGIEVDPDAVRYYAVLVQLRCAVTTGAAISRGGGALGLEAYRAPHHRFLSQLGAALCDAAGLAPTVIDLDELPDGGELPDDDPDVARLRGEVAGAQGATARLAAREQLLRAEHRAAWERWGRRLADADSRDTLATLGPASDPEAILARIEAAAPAGDEVVLDLLVRRAQRRQLLWDTPAAGGHTPIRAPERTR